MAQAFCRAGHIVYGQTRSPETGLSFEAEEIVPIVCNPLSDAGRETWGSIASDVDVREPVGSATLSHSCRLLERSRFGPCIGDIQTLSQMYKWKTESHSEADLYLHWGLVVLVSWAWWAADVDG